MVVIPRLCNRTQDKKAATAFFMEKSSIPDPSLLKDADWQTGNIHMTVNMKKIVMRGTLGEVRDINHDG